MPLRVALHRRVEELLDPAKATISSNLRSISRLRHAEDGAVQIDVFAAGEFGVEAGADFQQAGRRGRGDGTRPSVGSVMRRQDLEQRALAGAVAADDADDFAGLHLERDVAQRPEGSVR